MPINKPLSDLTWSEYLFNQQILAYNETDEWAKKVIAEDKKKRGKSGI